MREATVTHRMDPRIEEVVLSKDNIGQTAALNRVWRDNKADLLGKLDNDCLMTAGWTRILSRAHEDIADLTLFFASDRSAHLTGQLVSVSGGSYMP